MSINTETLRRRSSRISTATKRFDPSNLDDATLTAIPKRRKHPSPLEEDRPAKRSRNTNTTQTGNRQKGGGSLSTSIKKERSKKNTASCYDPTDFPLRPNSEWRIGPHVSAAGGVENTIINAASIGATAFALFVKSQRKWTSPPTKPESISSFKDRLKEFGYSADHILPHGSYLMNMGNPDKEKRQKSYECFVDELKRCEELGLRLYNFHPGSTVGQVTVEESLSFIAECINNAHKETSSIVIVIENMAGAGNVIGGPYSQLGGIIKQVKDKTRVGVCLDTCHMFAAGYDIRTKDGWNTMMDEFEREVGLQYLRGMHLNDSKTELGSRKDRHENIGLGHITLSAFANIVSDPRTKHIPLILETPAFDGPGSNLGQGMDVWKKEVEILHRLSSLRDADGKADTEAIDGGESDEITEKLEAWTEEIRKVVGEASKGAKGKGDGNNGKKVGGRSGKEKTASGGGVAKGTGKRKEKASGKTKGKEKDGGDGVSDSSGLSSMSDEE